MKNKHHSLCRSLLLLGGLLLASSAKADLAADIEKMTGAPTRITWLRGINNEGGFNPFWDSYQYKIMVFDTKEGKERELVPAAKIAWPRITPDGRNVLYSKSKKAELKDDSDVWIVDWAGKTNKFFAPGYVYAVYRDPKTKIQWAYIGEKFLCKSLKRYRIDKPSVSEVVFGTEKNLTIQELHVTRDGKTGFGLFPHPRACMMDMTTGEIGPPQAEGCNLSIAPDNSLLHWIMDGSHRTVHVFDASGKQISQIPLHQGGEGMNGSEVWNPEWTNKPRIFTINGPYVRLHLPGANIYIGQLDEKVTKVERYIRVTNTADANVNQDCWIASGIAVK